MKIIVGVSGGPDSMLLAYLLTKKIGKNNLIIAHYNHKFRKTSDIEEKELKKIFKNYNFISDFYTGNDFRESSLRTARYNFFRKIGWGKYYLALGHNLTDRIETSFINLLRGGGIDGFLNMKKIDNNKKILRPLINIPKPDIQKKCDILNIPYFIDETNKNEKISIRNLLRQKVISLLENLNYRFYYSFKNLYSQIEEIYPTFNIPNYLTLTEKGYLVKIPSSYQRFFVKQLLDFYGVNDLRNGVIDEILDYIKYAKGGGFKKYGNIILFKKNNKIFLKFDKN